MSKLTVINNISLDGVMQAPGRPDEDTRGGFEHGGWARPYNDPVLGKLMGAGMAEGGPLLLGRRTYEDFATFWPHQPDNPYTEALDNAHKYVATTTLAEPLPWRNSSTVTGDDVPALKERLTQPLTVLGSGELVRWLAVRDLVDEYVLIVHPLVLGSGRRMFADQAPRAAFELVDSTPTTTGVIVATYRRTR
ncbi:dihydrofolate reductase family protein [Nonomuraea africana]|uniref:Dihydrofolate reductase n=1 Tax=Nonomuraea africana TaxID=46171 RepID=A0ABR9KCD1_9ACTN|nr:dihydrofolate reductase family protein [Nonomuraea africana]MBE1559672.1 dihydrofolate reductase [Nonomuraea africana]